MKEPVTTSHFKDPAIIAGGGIGGLSMAVALAKVGMRSLVLEKAPRFGEIGAGIQLGPNAFHCFDYLGLAGKARSEAVYIDALRLMDATSGEAIAHIPLGDDFKSHMGNPYAVVHRADLHNELLEACKSDPKIELRSSHKVTGYMQDGEAVLVSCEGQDTIKGAFLIGAEGLNSAIRAQMLGDGAPRISGHTTYRSVIPTEKMPEDLRWNAATLWAGPKCHIVHYPLKGWKVFNLVVTYHRDVKEAVAGRPVSKEEVAVGFEHIHPRARQIIDHGEDWKLWVLCDRDPVTTWVDGRVALLGDAAHPMLQYLAQGACMAMEDAVCLSRSLARMSEDVEAALHDYQQKRMVRTARVQLGSRLIGDYVYHPEGANAMVRNEIMSKRTPQEWYDRLDWLYGPNALES